MAYFAWAPGTGVSTVDPGNRDVSADLPFSFQTELPEASPIRLSASGNPVIGGSMSFQTDNLPASSLLSIYLLSTGQINPGVDLGIINAGGCSAYVTLPETLSAVQLGGPSAATTISIPNDPYFAGFSFYSQSIALDPTANVLGVMTTNGVASYMNSF